MKRQSVAKLCSSAFALVSMFLLLFGCSGDNGAPGSSTGTIKGTVTSSLTAVPVAGATVTTSPALQGAAAITTDTNGNFTANNFPIGTYQVTVAKTGYTSQTVSVSVTTTTQPATNSIKLVPTTTAAVSVANVTAAPGAAATLTAVPSIADGITGTPTYTWTQVSGPTMTIANATSATPAVTLPAGAATKLKLATSAGMRFSEYSSAGNAANAAATGKPYMVVDLATDNRYYNSAAPAGVAGAVFMPFEKLMVQSFTNHDISNGTAATFQVTMTVGSYTATDLVTVNTKLPAVPNGGIRNVPVGQPVIFNAPTQSAYSWSIATAPTGSTATLNDATSRNPDFIPDVVGTYTLKEATAGTLTLYVGTWVGAISGQDQYGPTIGSTGDINSCGFCHLQTTDKEYGKFTRAWNKSGHAHIVTGLPSTLPGGPTVQNISDPAGHWSPSGCGPCHTVGFAQYSSPIKAGGFSEVYRAESLKITNGPNAWTQTLANYPKSARLMNIQCENCHGPTGSNAHQSSQSTSANYDFTARVNESSAVCGTCHGEPTRHGRYPQWAASAHGDYTVAQNEGPNQSCGGCHSYNGFDSLNKQLQGGNASRTINAADWANVQADIALNGIQPQNCITCHATHNPGTRSGLTGSIVGLAGYDPTYGTTFVGTTPLLPGGFQANGVGKGALCVVCHNSRNGEPVSGAGNPTLHEDNDANWGTLTKYSGPHDAAQGDVLMGRNAYFVTGVRSKHSLIADTCVTCHMELTAAPAPYDGGGFGTNHNFGADPAVCAKCHGNAITTADGVQNAFNASMVSLNTAIINAVVRVYNAEMGTSITAANVAISYGFPVGVTVNGTAYKPANTTKLDTLAKAIWNYGLLSNDSSQGVHNPQFAFDVLTSTMAKVTGL